MKVFDFRPTNNMINLDKPSELKDTHTSQNYRLRIYMRDKRGQRRKYGAVFTIECLQSHFTWNNTSFT